MYTLSASGFIPASGRRGKPLFSTSRYRTRTDNNGGIGTADFDYMMRTQLPEKYMPEVFGVMAGEDPDLRQLLHNASRNGIGITYLLFKIPYDRHKQLIKYLSK